jgi:hypothetical protein
MQLPSSAGLTGGRGHWVIYQVGGRCGVRCVVGMRVERCGAWGLGVLSSCCRAVSNLIEMTGIWPFCHRAHRVEVDFTVQSPSFIE